MQVIKWPCRAYHSSSLLKKKKEEKWLATMSKPNTCCWVSQWTKNTAVTWWTQSSHYLSIHI